MYPSEQYCSFGVFVQRVNLGLKEFGVEIDEVTMTRKETKLERLLSYVCFFFKSVFKIVFFRYDILYFHYPTHTMLPYKFVGFLSSAKIVLNFHGSDIMSESFISKVLRRIFKGDFESCDLVISPSLYFVDMINMRFKVKDYFISPSGGVNDLLYEEKYFTAGVECSKKNIFGFLSRINESKGWNIAFDAFESLCRDLPEGEQPAFIFAGPVFDKNVFHERIRSSKYNVKYVGELNDLEINDFFKSIDFFVFPTMLPESLGLVALEAMASSVPVVASRIGAISEYVNIQNGMLFSPGNIVELKNCMKSLLESDSAEIIKKQQYSKFTAERYRNKVVSKNLYVRLNNLVSR